MGLKKSFLVILGGFFSQQMFSKNVCSDAHVLVLRTERFPPVHHMVHLRTTAPSKLFLCETEMHLKEACEAKKSNRSEVLQERQKAGSSTWKQPEPSHSQVVQSLHSESRQLILGVTHIPEKNTPIVWLHAGLYASFLLFNTVIRRIFLGGGMHVQQFQAVASVEVYLTGCEYFKVTRTTPSSQ